MILNAVFISPLIVDVPPVKLVYGVAKTAFIGDPDHVLMLDAYVPAVLLYHVTALVLLLITNWKSAGCEIAVAEIVRQSKFA